MSGADNRAQTLIGQPHTRIDGLLKVTGQARYGSDAPLSNPAFACLVTSGTALGQISALDVTAARQLPGVLDIMTYENIAGQVAPVEFFSKGGQASTSIRPLESAKIWHDGQIVAVVLADSFETARDAAHRVKVSYAEQIPSAGFGAPGVTEEPGGAADEKHEDPKVGDAEAAFAAAPVKIEARYSTPTQHHNPIELFTTSCVWSNGNLVIHEPSQYVYGLKAAVAKQLGIDPAKVRVLSPFIGGAFGSRGAMTQRTALIAIAARKLNRPVKLVASRAQGFTIATYRAETRQHLKLAADRSGKLQALTHEGWEVSSRPDPYKVGGTETTSRVYACPNVATKVTIVHADRNTPGFMRSPPEVPYMFALESGMDELAVALNIDPVELRRVNDTKVEPIKGLPYTSRSLMPCFDAAAAAFGWSKRSPAPGSMRDGEWLIGWGCATTCYPTNMGPAAARVSLSRQGKVKVQTAGHEIGTGAYTVYGMTAADRLGVSLDDVVVEMGDTDLPPAPVAGGSNSTASVCTVVAKACEDIRAKLASAAVQPGGPFAGRDPAGLTLASGALRAPDGKSEALDAAVQRVSHGVIEAYAENLPHGVTPDGLQKLFEGATKLSGGAKLKDRIQYAFGAEFVEVRVHARTREVRAPRLVGAFAAGRIVNPTTARSQLMGGLIWGVSAALHEQTEIDREAARYVNTNLADYLIPVNADIGQVEVILVPETDRQVNDIGIKGLGELGNVGTNAAVANAVYHATGKRIRDLPIRLEQLI